MKQWTLWEEKNLGEELKNRAAQMDIELSDRQLSQFEAYGALLVEWNEKMNLTAITDPEEILEKHFLDSISSVPILREMEHP